MIASAEILSMTHIARDCDSIDARDALCAETVRDITDVGEETLK